MNTTARIQACCNENNVDILTSGAFGNMVYKLPEGLQKETIGKVQLHGKSEEIILVTYREQ